jgi:hypothetical protein
VDVASGAVSRSSFASHEEAQRAHPGLLPMERRMVREPSWDDIPSKSRAGELALSYDHARQQLTLSGPIRRRMELTIHDHCDGQPRVWSPNRVTVFFARGMALVWGSNRSGQEGCSDHRLWVVTASQSFVLR